MRSTLGNAVVNMLRASMGETTIRRLRGLRSRFETTEQTFSRIRRNNSWGSKESVSGQGSTLEYTENIRREIPPLLEKLGVRRILDAPCGDYNWFRLIPRPGGLKYVGGDIVQDIVARNAAAHSDVETEFVHLDITTDKLPAADLWLCRDALFHLSNRHIQMAIANFLRSDIGHILTTSHTLCPRNQDIPSGDFRELNLELAPIGFPPPILWIDDWIEGFPVRKLGLWKRTDLAKALG